MNIRKAKKEDLHSLTKFLIEFKEGLINYEPDDFKVFQRKEKSFSSVKRSIKAEIDNKQGLFLVVEDEGELIGFAFGMLQKSHSMVFKTVKSGLLKHIWIKEEYRGKGFASKLKSELFKWFRRNGCRYIRLSVLDINPAKHVYEKWGFEMALDSMVKVIKP